MYSPKGTVKKNCRREISGRFHEISCNFAEPVYGVHANEGTAVDVNGKCQVQPDVVHRH